MTSPQPTEPLPASPLPWRLSPGGNIQDAEGHYVMLDPHAQSKDIAYAIHCANTAQQQAQRIGELEAALAVLTQGSG